MKISIKIYFGLSFKLNFQTPSWIVGDHAKTEHFLELFAWNIQNYTLLQGYWHIIKIDIFKIIRLNQLEDKNLIKCVTLNHITSTIIVITISVFALRLNVSSSECPPTKFSLWDAERLNPVQSHLCRAFYARLYKMILML